MVQNLFMPDLAVIKKIEDETHNIRLLTISRKTSDRFTIVPGQFVEITLFGKGEFPVSVSAVTDAKGTFQTTVQQEKGRVTKEIKNLKAGATIGIRGPFGNGFPMEQLRGKNICIITGGIGLAAVWMLLDNILKSRKQYGSIKLLHGARTPEDLIYRDSFLYSKKDVEKRNIEVFLTVDKAAGPWKGHVGVVTELFQKADLRPADSVVVMCGPGLMMKYALRGLSERGFLGNQILLSMERRMQCGVGICGHCMIGHKRVCLDGPVFYYGDLKEESDHLF